MKQIIRHSIVAFSILWSFVTTASQQQTNCYTVRLLTGAELKELVPFIVTLRITMFSEYPYLYDGDYYWEVHSLTAWAEHPESAVAVAFIDDRPIGFLTGSNLTFYFSYINIPIDEIFKNNGLDAANYYYCNEIIILPKHRGNHLSALLFNALEQHAQNMGYSAASLVTEIHETHPLKPINYKAHNWNYVGYAISPIRAKCWYPTHQADGTVQMEEHELTYWLKNFTQN